MKPVEHDASFDRSLLERLYRRLLCLYPAAVRARFGGDMGDLFRDLYRAQRRRHGTGGTAWLVARALAEVPFRALQARREERRAVAAAPWLRTHRTDRREDLMDSLLLDLKFTIRTLAKTPAFTAVAVLSLALGIGANTAIFSVLNAVFLRPLPYPEPARLVMPAPDFVEPSGEIDEIGVWSYPYFEALREHNEVLDDLAAFTSSALNLTGSETPDRVRVEYVTSPYFSLLGIDPRLGRLFLPEETEKGAEEALVVLAFGTWQQRFGSDPDVLGRRVHLNGVAHTVVGVAPPGFEGLSRGVELWLPFPMTQRLISPRRLVNAYGFWHSAVGRLRDGVTLEEASATLPSLAALLTEKIPMHPSEAHMTMRLIATSLRQAQTDAGLRNPLLLLLAAVSLVLLIACANVANLLLSRAVSRRREIGVRLALGAGRGRLIRQFLTESSVLGLLAAAAGIALAGLGLRGLESILPRATPDTWSRYAEAVDSSAITIDLNVLVFTTSLALLASLAFGLVPALGYGGADLRGALVRAGSLPVSLGSLRRVSARSLLVVTQMALALVLLVGAGLLIRSLDRMRATEAGFDPTGVLTAHVYLPRDAYADRAGPFFEQLMERLAALPGVESASQGISLPLLRDSSSTMMKIQGEDSAGVEHGVGYHLADRDHLQTLGIPLLRGRAFASTDRQGAPLVALVNQTAVDRHFGGEDPVGRRIWIGMGMPRDQWAEIVGVVGDVRYEGVDQAVGPDVYVPAQQWPERFTVLLLRTAGDPLSLAGGLRREIAALDPNLPVYDVATLEEATAESMSHTRFLALLLATFAGLAIVLAATGIYGVMAYAVSTRTRELGIRMALGARRESILGLVLYDGLWLAVAGVVAGLLAAVVLTRFLANQLYGVGTLDPTTLGVTTATLVAVALAASFWPAHRAGRVDPTAALRSE